MAIDEGHLEDVGSGLAPTTPGWFVVNAGEAAWVRNDAFGNGTIVYPRSETALAHDAGVETETPAPSEAYAPFPRWRLGRPDAELPWAGPARPA